MICNFTKEELELIVEGIASIIEEYCCSAEEEIEPRKLLDKVKKMLYELGDK